MCVARREQPTLQALDVRVGEGGGDEDPSETATSIRRVEKDVAQPREGGTVTHPSSDPDLDILGAEQTDHERPLEGSRDDVERSPLRPVALFTQPAVHAIDVDRRPLVTQVEPVGPRPTHAASVRSALGQLAKHEVQDPTVAVVLGLGGRVDPQAHRERHGLAVLTRGTDLDLGNGLSSIEWCQSAHGEDLGAVELVGRR